MTKTEAALQVMNPGHPLEQRPIPVKTQPILAKTPVVWSTLELCGPWKIPKQHGQPLWFTLAPPPSSQGKITVKRVQG